MGKYLRLNKEQITIIRQLRQKEAGNLNVTPIFVERLALAFLVEIVCLLPSIQQTLERL